MEEPSFILQDWLARLLLGFGASTGSGEARGWSAEKAGQFGVGDAWSFTAIDADPKLMLPFSVGSRDSGCATKFIQDLASRLVNRVQLTMDGHKMYLFAVEDAFSGGIDFAQLVKICSNAPSGPETRYSPAECIGAEKHAVTGCPAPKHTSTS